MFKNALKAFDFTQIPQLLTSGRDKIYLMTYAANMFSCYTTEENATTMENIPLNATNNVMFGAEQEYILWGSSDAKRNVDNTRNTIFGIRLLLNIIYAYTGDPEITTETLTMATAIAGWTGFGIPIVQNALIITAAIAESAYDTARLMDGEAVPLYKTPLTWVFKFRGLMDATVEELAGRAIEAASTKLYEEMNRLTAETTEAFGKELEKYTENVIETTVGTAMNAVKEPINEAIIWAASYMSEAEGNMRSDVTARINMCFDDMRSRVESETGIVAEVKLMVLNHYDTSANRAELVEMMMEASGISEGQGAVRTLSNKVEEWFNTKEKDIKQILLDYVEDSGIVTEFQSGVGEILADVNETSQAAINNKLNEFMGNMGSGRTPISTADNTVELANFDGASAATFSMTYEDYIMVFMSLKFMTNEDDAIKKIGNLIQANMSKENSAYYAKDFKLENAFTMIQVEAKAYVKPTFINIPNRTADLGAAEKDLHPIIFKSIVGY